MLLKKYELLVSLKYPRSIEAKGVYFQSSNDEVVYPTSLQIQATVIVRLGFHIKQ